MRSRALVHVFVLLFVMAAVFAIMPASFADGPLEGKVQMTDSLLMRVTIQTDGGSTESFSVTHGGLLKGVTVGDRVRLFVGKDGMVSEVRKLEGPQSPPPGGR